MTAQKGIYSTLASHLFCQCYIGTNPLTVGLCGRHCRPLWPQGAPLGAPCFLLLYFQPRGLAWFCGNAVENFCHEFSQNFQSFSRSPTLPKFALNSMRWHYYPTSRWKSHTGAHSGRCVPNACQSTIKICIMTIHTMPCFNCYPLFGNLLFWFQSSSQVVRYCLICR